jgi:hypothetical protein
MENLAVAMKLNPEMAYADLMCHALRPEKYDHLQRKYPRSKYKTTEEWAEAVIKELNATQPTNPMEKAATAGFLNLFTAAASLSGDTLMEKVLALDERLEAMSDRSVKRLIQLKAMKPMLNLTSSETAGDRPKKIVSSR